MTQKEKRERFGNVRKYDRLAAACVAGKRHPRFEYTRKERFKAWHTQEGWRFKGNDIGAMLVGLLGNQAGIRVNDLMAKERHLSKDDACAELLGIRPDQIKMIEQNLPQGLGLYGALRAICHMKKRRDQIPIPVSARTTKLAAA